MAEGNPPYSHLHPYRAMFAIKFHPPQGLSQPEKYSAEYNSFVSKCLTLDPKQRPSAKELLQHPFILKKAKGKGILNELVNESIDYIERFRLEQSLKNEKKDFSLLPHPEPMMMLNEPESQNPSYENAFLKINSTGTVIEYKDHNKHQDKKVSKESNHIENDRANQYVNQTGTMREVIPEEEFKVNTIVEKDGVPESLEEPLFIKFAKYENEHENPLITFDYPVNRKKSSPKEKESKEITSLDEINSRGKIGISRNQSGIPRELEGLSEEMIQTKLAKLKIDMEIELKLVREKYELKMKQCEEAIEILQSQKISQSQTDVGVQSKPKEQNHEALFNKKSEIEKEPHNAQNPRAIGNNISNLLRVKSTHLEESDQEKSEEENPSENKSKVPNFNIGGSSQPDPAKNQKLIKNQFPLQKPQIVIMNQNQNHNMIVHGELNGVVKDVDSEHPENIEKPKKKPVKGLKQNPLQTQVLPDKPVSNQNSSKNAIKSNAISKKKTVPEGGTKANIFQQPHLKSPIHMAKEPVEMHMAKEPPDKVEKEDKNENLKNMKNETKFSNIQQLLLQNEKINKELQISKPKDSGLKLFANQGLPKGKANEKKEGVRLNIPQSITPINGSTKILFSEIAKQANSPNNFQSKFKKVGN